MKNKTLKIFVTIFCLFAFINVSKAEDLNELFNKIIRIIVRIVIFFIIFAIQLHRLM